MAKTSGGLVARASARAKASKSKDNKRTSSGGLVARATARPRANIQSAADILAGKKKKKKKA